MTDDASLRQSLTEALNTAISDPDTPRGRHDEHSYDAGCYVCRGDVSQLVAAVLPAVGAELDRVRSERVVSAIWGSREESAPRPFGLYRHEDVTGASGTGLVATGVRFDDGTVVIRWRGDLPSTVVWPSIEAAEKVHGHGGKTHIVWLAEPIAELCAAIEQDMAAARQEAGDE